MIIKNNDEYIQEVRTQFEMYSLEDLVPKDHLLRKVDKVFDLSFIYELVQDKYSLDNGRPSIDPVMLIKIVLIQHLFGIKSMRQTIKEIETNFAYRWYLGLGIQDKVPHFSTFGKNYSRRFYDNEIFEEIFSRILQVAIDNNFVDNTALFIDSTHIKANDNKKKFVTEEIIKTANHYEKELIDDINEFRESNGKKPLKNKKEVEKKKIKISSNDPDAGCYVKSEREKQFAYSAHTCCDSFGYIIDHHITAGNIHDSTQLVPMIERLEQKNLLPRYVAVDSGYKTPHNAKFLLEKEIIPAMPYKRPLGPKDLMNKNQFLYDEHFDVYICPNDQFLNYKRIDRDGYKLYFSNPNKCKDCPLLKQCTKSENHTKVITRHIWQENLDIVDDLRFIDTIKNIYSMRSQTIERRFADAKEQHGMRWTKYTGIQKVTMETTLIFACMNLKKLAKHLVA
ncbi:IS1182 family transposase [Macrococcoides canis]|uniref:IS1182 family transposase n=1 Tax=Macrococcoides canis TaxID=1855823 RepID=UPI0013E9939A|nr:IS1182 family transposase [Macrococcus canis]QIH76857.1 IS1182 family transposase [Macrococcus canis]